MRVLACLLLACLGCTSELRPFGEAIVIVDTDAPVPKLVNTLRVDFYRDDGTWFDTLETRALGPEAWPVSFSVFNEDETTTRAVVLRLRAYSAGKVRDYRGERFSDRPIGAPRDPVPDPIPPQNGDPRLVRDGLDITPATEPLPNLTIDRLARIELPPGEVGASMLVLRAACAGTMANLATRESCIDVEGVRGPLTTLPVETGLERPASLAGSAFTFEPCPAEAPDPDAVCVPGG
ncbi:MAG TPA: hypothetical protein VFB62_09400, partial [Polyangiaceae bacterium]|nr:hypothetical protein [Polyangiaceae bacterium]